MTTLRERAEEIDKLMQKVKIEWVASKPEETDLAIYVHAYRGQDMVTALQCPLDRDKALHACQIVAVGMSADTIVMTFESWHSKLRQSPITEKDWAPGEMAFVGKTYPEAREQGWVDECLTTNAWDRDLNVVMISTPYLISEDQVSFSEATIFDSDEDGVDADGYMTQIFRKIMQQPTIHQKMEEKTEEVAGINSIAMLVPDPEVRQFHMDAAALKSMAEQDLISAATLLADPGSDREQMIKDRFGEDAV